MRILLSAALLLGLAGCEASPAAEGEPAPTTTTADGGEAAAYQLRPVTGEALRPLLAGLGHDLVVLNVWAPWCGPCIDEFPEFVRFSENAPDGVAVRFLAVDDTEPNIRDFLNRQGLRGETYIQEGAPQAFVDAFAPYWGPGIPATFLVDSEGEVVDGWMGAVNYAQLEARVTRALQASS